MKDNVLRDELKECVPTKATTRTFHYSHKNKTVTVQLKQFPPKLGHSITMHSSQGSTLEYIEGDLDCTSTNGNAVKINLEPIYTILLSAKNRDTFQLVN